MHELQALCQGLHEGIQSREGGREGLERRLPPQRPEANAVHLGLSDGDSEGERKKKLTERSPLAGGNRWPRKSASEWRDPMK